jgi:hypothetical protein
MVIGDFAAKPPKKYKLASLFSFRNMRDRFFRSKYVTPLLQCNDNHNLHYGKGFETFAKAPARAGGRIDRALASLPRSDRRQECGPLAISTIEHIRRLIRV